MYLQYSKSPGRRTRAMQTVDGGQPGLSMSASPSTNPTSCMNEWNSLLMNTIAFSINSSPKIKFFNVYIDMCIHRRMTNSLEYQPLGTALPV
jgi:hypothetical protein